MPVADARVFVAKDGCFRPDGEALKVPSPLWGRVRAGGPSQAIEAQHERSEEAEAARPSFQHPTMTLPPRNVSFMDQSLRSDRLSASRLRVNSNQFDCHLAIPGTESAA